MTFYMLTYIFQTQFFSGFGSKLATYVEIAFFKGKSNELKEFVYWENFFNGSALFFPLKLKYIYFFILEEDSNF